MRTFVAALVVLLSGASAQAGMTPEEMAARLQEIDAELKVLFQGPRVHTMDSIQGDLRDLDRRKFESDLELARVNARREVVLIRAKEEEARNRAENEVLQRKLEMVAKQRSMVQNEMEKTSEKVDSGTLPPSEVTTMKLQLIKLDQETATLEYQISGDGSPFSAALTEIEIDLAGISAVRKALDERGMELNRRYQQLSDLQVMEAELRTEREILVSELAERQPAKRLSPRQPVQDPQ